MISSESPELHSPVLFLVFNRPESTARVFNALRLAKPLRLYVAADGPRSHVATDVENCRRVKEIVNEVDWPCKVTTLFRDENLGCGRAISSAITWFFEHEPEGIILEDDCLPVQGFFRYCQELLGYYRNDTRVMHIGGNNFLNGSYDPTHSYYFARNGHIWGWATWRRAWQNYDLDMALYNTVKASRYFENFFLNPVEKLYRLRKLGQAASRKIDTWDYQWDFARYIHSGLAIVPNKNLVTNIGFGTDATHTRGSRDSKYAKLRAHEISFPLRHPPLVLRDLERERRYFSILMKDIVISRLTFS
jgi:hypothetical protein